MKGNETCSAIATSSFAVTTCGASPGGHRRRSGARQLIQSAHSAEFSCPSQAFCLSSLSTRLSNSGYRRFARRRIGSYGANGLSRYRHAVGAAHPDRGRARDWLVLRRGFELPPLMFTEDEAEAIAVGVRCSRAPAIQERLAQRSKLDPPAYDGTRTAAPAFQRTRKTGHHRNRRGIRGPSADAISMRATKRIGFPMTHRWREMDSIGPPRQA